ncbi:MAG TPA: N-methyl-L-tryptophan oxidase [Candidatus Limnocylindrales bacterium]|nr:N-methyl-L-tryptophan oxidase [Candidatus Limnocylindrales bacterium]
MARDRSADAIVVGLGAHGSATAAALARRGLRVLGLERFGRGEARGSSGGRSRIIRIAHYERPSYAPLAHGSWDRWLALEAETGASILTRTGGLYAGPAASSVVAGASAAARAHALGHEVVDADEIRRRWPAFSPADGTVGVVEEQAGVLRADVANAAHLAVAERAGAELRFGTQVIEWRPVAGGGVEVVLADGAVLGAERMILTTGPWLGDLVADLDLPLAVERQPVCWFAPAVPDADVAVGRLPIWLYDTEDDGTFYGFPHDPELGLKVSHHHSGEVVGAETVDREVRLADVERIRRFIRARMPAADGPLTSSTVCLYTNTPDDEFVVDRHPEVSGVAFASACSGHGFKFAPLIGEMLADLAVNGATDLPIEPFRSARFD